MKYWLGVTDNAWFSYQEQHRFDEMNFWQPSATPPFKNASEGMPFLFKLKKPYNHIVGGGFFVTYSTLPIKLAWDTFEVKNGVSSFKDLKSIISPLSGSNTQSDSIGCTILANPFFFDRNDWIETPSSFALNIVRGKMYDTENSDGAELWNKVAEKLKKEDLFLSKQDSPSIIRSFSEKYGKPYLTKPRIGQSTFRLLVTEAYKRRCAMTGESTLPVLEAAHIVPYAEGGTHDVTNGLLLRADFHKLYDAGLVSITADYLIKVSSQIREAWFNGKAYYRLQDQILLSMPESIHLKPNKDALDWHFKNRFVP
jgi:putative restriction endonuclease